MFGTMEQGLEHWRKNGFACIYSCVDGGMDGVGRESKWLYLYGAGGAWKTEMVEKVGIRVLEQDKCQVITSLDGVPLIKLYCA